MNYWTSVAEIAANIGTLAAAFVAVRSHSRATVRRAAQRRRRWQHRRHPEALQRTKTGV
ncbi:hypothetical protein AB0F81_03850 [Actinoplanes sp. NPDC024001]|uniref:hypothetical protein n=1 Tax=Actinoplanes sp. NPDC024001 TaxID=3154598 RepID=UPI0033F369F7